MTVSSCERCGYTAMTRTMDAGCPRCAERAVRAQMRRFAAVQARHLREMRTGAVYGGEIGRGRS
jgi:predicted PP-loop superfamily ATPase